jgi:hypothetical protein
MKNFVSVVIACAFSISAFASNANASVDRDLFLQFQDKKVLLLGIYGSAKPIISVVSDILRELSPSIDWVSLGIDSDLQEQVDKYVFAESEKLELGPSFQYYFEFLNIIRDANQDERAKPLRVIAAGLNSNGLSTKGWIRDRGNHQFETTKVLSGNFDGRGIVIGTPHYIAKERFVPMTFLASRLGLADDLVETAGFQVRNHPAVNKKTLHVWIEQAQNGLEAFSEYYAERVPSRLRLRQLKMDGELLLISTSHPLFLNKEQLTFQDRSTFPKNVYRISSNYDYFMSLDREKPVSFSCLRILSKVAQGLVSRILSFPY